MMIGLTLHGTIDFQVRLLLLGSPMSNLDSRNFDYRGSSSHRDATRGHILGKRTRSQLAGYGSSHRRRHLDPAVRQPPPSPNL